MGARTTEEPALSAAGREALRRLGYPELPEVAAALATPVERGHHVAALAAEGSGREVLYALAAVGRCDPALGAVQALALAPTREAAGRIALAARALGAPAGLTARTFLEAEAATAPLEAPAPHLLAGRPGPLLAEVRAGRLGLGGLRLLILDGVAALDAVGAWEPVEAILDTLPGDAQKIVISDRVDGRLEDLLVRQLHRARRWPLELFETDGEAGAAAGHGEAPPLLCAGASSEAGRLDLLEAAVRSALGPQGDGAALVRFGPDESPERAAAVLETRGLPAEADERGSLRIGGGTAGPTAILYGTPLGLARLTEALGEADRRAAIVPSAHLRHVELLAARAGWRVRSLAGWSAGEAYDAILAYRQRVQGQIERGDAAAELLVLEPLLAEYGADRVAAALSALLRRRRTAEGAVRPWPDVEAASGLGAPADAAIAPERGVRPAWTRIWIGVGKRDGVRPADVVGAITGETGIVGGQIGKVDIRTGFSLVDVDSQVVDLVIRKLNGAMIRGREAVVRPDRGG